VIRPWMILAIIGALGGAGGVWYVMDLRSDNAALTAANASLTREKAVAEDVAEQAKIAREVSDAEAERLRTKAKEYDEITEWIIANDDEAPIPDILRIVLDRVLPGSSD
jgi:hypothetical protein